MVKCFFTFPLVDGNWGAWGAWSGCSKTCKEGKQSRVRKCNAPAPKYGGKLCSGESKETIACNKDVPCPGKDFFHYLTPFILSAIDLKVNLESEIDQIRVNW